MKFYGSEETENKPVVACLLKPIETRRCEARPQLQNHLQL